jgi:nucleoside-diphosphate-sugar epimerase
MMSNWTLPMNLGNPAEITVLEFAREVLRATGSRSRIVFKPLPEDDPKKRQPDIQLARKLLEWSPKVDVREGLEKTVAYFRGRV